MSSISDPNITTLHLLTLQQVYDFVVSKIYEQGAAAYDKKKARCRYRDPHGRSCAAGMLITDEQYREWRPEGLGVSSLITRHSPAVLYRMVNLVDMLQSHHDLLYGLRDPEDFREAWLQRAHGVADLLKLTPWMPKKGEPS